MSPENYTTSTAFDGEDLNPGNIEAATIQSITTPSKEVSAAITTNAHKVFIGNAEQTAEPPINDSVDSAESIEDGAVVTTPEITKSPDPLTNFSEKSAVTDQLDAVADLAKKEAPQPATNTDEAPKVDDIQNSSTAENTATDEKDDTAETDHTTQKDTVTNIPEIVLPAVATPEEHTEVTDEAADVAPPETADVPPEDTDVSDAEPEPVVAESAPKEEENEENAKQVEAAPAAAEPEIVIVNDEKSAEKENQENPDQSAASNEAQTDNTAEVAPPPEQIGSLENISRFSGDTPLLDLANYFDSQGSEGKMGDTLRALHQNIEAQNNYGQVAA